MPVSSVEVMVVADGTIDDLKEAEKRIERSAEEMHDQLVYIRDKRLYAYTHRTFEEYCRDRWNIGRSRGYQIIDAAEIRKQIKSQAPGTPPPNEAQARVLKQVPPEQRGAVWKEAVDAGKKNGTHVTAATVRRVARPVTEPRRGPEWEQFLLDNEDICSTLRAVSRKMAEVYGYDANTKKFRERWAYFLTHLSTIGTVNALIRTIETNMPAQKTDRPPGFLPVRVVKMRSKH